MENTASHLQKLPLFSQKASLYRSQNSLFYAFTVHVNNVEQTNFQVRARAQRAALRRKKLPGKSSRAAVVSPSINRTLVCFPLPEKKKKKMEIAGAPSGAGCKTPGFSDSKNTPRE